MRASVAMRMIVGFHFALQFAYFLLQLLHLFFQRLNTLIGLWVMMTSLLRHVLSFRNILSAQTPGVQSSVLVELTHRLAKS